LAKNFVGFRVALAIAAAIELTQKNWELFQRLIACSLSWQEIWI